MFDLDSLIANKDLILKDRDNRADVQKVLSVYAEKVSSDYVVKAKWEDIFSALLQGMKVQAQVITFTEADEEAETDASAVIETYELYDATVTADGFSVNGTDLSASSADAYPVGSLSRPGGGGGGGEGGVFLVETEIVNLNVQLKKTWKEITDAAEAGSVVVLKTGSDAIPGGTVLCYLSGYGMDEYDGTEYYVEFLQGEMPSPAVTYASTESESGYPTINV